MRDWPLCAQREGSDEFRANIVADWRKTDEV